MSFGIELHRDRVWLVVIPAGPRMSTDTIKLARFVNAEAAQAWTQEFDRALLMAREAGRMGLA